MAQISEVSADQNALAAALRDGVDSVSLNQSVVVTAYTKAVLPIDGCVFWSPLHQITVKGSLHYQQEIAQNEDETYGGGSVRFTSQGQITQFSEDTVNTIWVAALPDGARFVFSAQQGRYDQAGIWHYFGRLLSPALAAQLLDDPKAIDPTRAITSNSLALWLGLNTFTSDFDLDFNTQGTAFIKAPITLYPSKLSPANLKPPYGTVHIGDNDTEALQSAPYIDANRNHWQLCKDRVRITLVGLQHQEAMDFVDTVNQYTLFTDNFGIMNMPVPRDLKQSESGLMAIAMKKVIDYEVSYNQARVAQFARQLILSATATYIVKG